MPVTVVLTLLASLLVALTLTPLLSSLVKKKSVSETKMQKRLDGLAANEYSRSLAWSLNRP